jgi:hypothetical protein
MQRSIKAKLLILMISARIQSAAFAMSNLIQNKSTTALIRTTRSVPSRLKMLDIEPLVFKTYDAIAFNGVLLQLQHVYFPMYFQILSFCF